VRASFIPILQQLKPLGFRYLKTLGLLLFASGMAILLLVIPPSPDVTRRVYEAGLEMILFLALIGMVLLGRRVLFGDLVGLTFTMSLFILSLVYKWQGFGADYFIVGGFLPWSDNYGYYDEAQRLLHGFNLTLWGARRPFLPAFLSVGLAITHNNFQAVLVIFVLLNALVVYLAAREVQASLKSAAGAAVYLIISFLFYRRFAGMVLTENLGFLMGNLALAFLLQGAREGEIKKLYWGLFILTIGLNARAGAFFVLPILVIWMTYFLRHKFIWRRIFAGAVFVILLGLGLNLVLLKLIGPSDSRVPFSNFSYTFYGLASGGRGWDQVLKDYPGVKEEDVPALAIRKFRENPYLLVVGITRSYRDFFTASDGAFSFALSKSDQKGFTNSMLWGLTAIGLIFAIVEWRGNRHLSVVLAGFLGILLSVGLLPPYDANLMRVYAATIPITVYIVSLGVSVPGTFLRNYVKSSSAERQPLFFVQDFSLPVSVTLLMALFFGALLVKQYGSLPEKRNKPACVPGNEQIKFLLDSGSHIVLEPDELIKESYVPYLRISDFMRQAGIYDPELSSALLALNQGAVLNLGIRVDDSAGEENIRSAFLVTTRILDPGYYELCVTGSDSGLSQIVPFYHSSLKPISSGQPVSYLPDITTINQVRFFYSVGGWILFGLTMLDIVQIWKYPFRTAWLVLVNTSMMSVGILVLLHSLGLAPIQWERVPLDTERVEHARGFSYVIDLGNTRMGKTRIWDYPVKLYENDIELDGPDQERSFIASEGAGRFTVMEGRLYFSSSDNSNPRENGRQYQVLQPTHVRTRYQLISYLLAFFGLFVHIRYLKRSSGSTDV